MASIKLAGDTSGEITIQAPAVAGTTTLNLPATSSTLATQNALGVRNLIINGDMRIAQRGTSVTGITSAGYNTVDRWTLRVNSTGTWTETQDTDVPSGQGFSNSFKLQCTTANASLSASASMVLQYRFEGQMLQHLKKGTSNAESTTLSFWVKSNKTGTYIANLYDTDNGRTISKSYTIDTADTWEKKTITYEGDTSGTLSNDNGRSLDFNLWLASGTDYTSGTLMTTWQTATSADRAVGQVNLADSTSNYINITGVQLEVGDTATPFEHRPYDMELARCQRYYWKWKEDKFLFHARDTNVLFGQFHHPVPMRANPSMSHNYTNPVVAAAWTGVGEISVYSNGWKSLSGSGASALLDGTSEYLSIPYFAGFSITAGQAGTAVMNEVYFDFSAEL